MNKLVELIKEIFGVCEISRDTKAIVLVLAGTLSSEKFKPWLDNIPQLNPVLSFPSSRIYFVTEAEHPAME